MEKLCMRIITELPTGINVVPKGKVCELYTTWQNSRNCVTFLYSHYLTFSERPRETFGPIACVNYDQEVHKRITVLLTSLYVWSQRSGMGVGPIADWGWGGSLVYACEFPIYNVGVGPFHCDHFPFKCTAIPPKKPDWGMGNLKSLRFQGSATANQTLRERSHGKKQQLKR